MIKEDDLKEFISKISLVEKESIGADTALLSSSVIDSTNVLELVCFIEERCGIKIKPMDMTLYNFDSISKITAFLEKSGK